MFLKLTLALYIVSCASLVSLLIHTGLTDFRANEITLYEAEINRREAFFPNVDVQYLMPGTILGSYEDKRCKCVCPSPAAVLNNTVGSDRKLYIGNVPPNKCNCDGVILPRVGELIKGREQEFCPRCECKYENRNTTIIKVVVIIVIWVIMLLVAYMGFLICLDPLINKRAKASYQEHTNEDDESSISGPSQQMGVRGNVLNRVTHQQDKWKRQVREQRRNIYDRHTMLN